MDIYLIRHGQSTGNGRGCFLGWGEHALTELGRAQAEAAAERLAPLGPMPVLCSDLARACETGAIIAARWGGAVQPDPRWREIHCGELENCPWDALRERPALAAQYEADPYGTAMPGGESVAMMAARVTAAFLDVLARADARLAIVTHDGPIRAVLAHSLQFPPTRFWTLTTNHGGLTHLAQSDDWLTIRTVNDTSHLKGLEASGSYQ